MQEEVQKDSCSTAGLQALVIEAHTRKRGNGAAIAWLLMKPDDKYSMHKGE